MNTAGTPSILMLATFGMELVDRAAALYHGLYGHGGAVMAEPYRRMTLFPFDLLPG